MFACSCGLTMCVCVRLWIEEKTYQDPDKCNRQEEGHVYVKTASMRGGSKRGREEERRRRRGGGGG